MAGARYDHQQIEAKWQKVWEEQQTFKVDIDLQKPKYYVLDMFPFPSGSGLHVGHVEGYTATDILARYKRKLGFNVLHPMGWDSFGLPAEQYAVRTGTHPAQTTKTNIDNFRRQLKRLGFSYDWSREFATSDPSYYKWTQWIFTKLCEKGLAYEAEVSVNFCPELGTVLANEEVEEGKSKEGGYLVFRKPLKQWILKITAYAERLIQDLDLVDWPQGLKKLQVNWIGKSEGAVIHFAVEKNERSISVFSTRPDTLFGCTYLVLAPEHSLIESITTLEQIAIVREYIKQTSTKSDFDRTEVNRNKTGVFTGSYAINPVNGEKLPIWIADYVLISYGTGAVMAVPAHDARDYEAAQSWGMPSKIVVRPKNQEMQHQVESGQACWVEEGVAINSVGPSLSLDGLSTQKAKEKIIDWLEHHELGERKIQYKLRDWLFSRQRYWGEPFPILHFKDGSKRCLDLDELPLLLPDLTDFKPSKDGQSPLSKAQDWVEIMDHKTGRAAQREINTMPNWAGSCWYYLRFCDPHNQDFAWGTKEENYWLPVDMYIGGVEHAVLHLLYARFWHKVFYDCGLVHSLEPFKTLRNQGLLVSRSYKTAMNVYVNPEDVIENEGKYYHKVSNEPLISQIEKMSKSKLNGVVPDEIIQEFGADSLRLYEMFMGPLEKEKVWNTDAVNGCRRFLSRLYDMVHSEKLTQEKPCERALHLMHKMIHGVTQDLDLLQFNTAIAKMMEFVNDFSQLSSYSHEVLKAAVHLLSPFSPHVAEEMWSQLGEKSSLTYSPWPIADSRYLQVSIVTYAIQVNGKLRGQLESGLGQDKEKIFHLAQEIPTVAKFLAQKNIQKVIFIQDKLINIVVSDA